MRPAGRRAELLDRRFGPGFATWSPDSKTVIVSTLQVYSSRYREGMNYLMALPLDGGKPRMIVPVEHKPVGKRSGDGPVWSPDGKQMAYVSEGVLHVVPVSATGGPAGSPRQVTKGCPIHRAGRDRISFGHRHRSPEARVTRRRQHARCADRSDLDAEDADWPPGGPCCPLRRWRAADRTDGRRSCDPGPSPHGDRGASSGLHAQGTLVDATGLTVMRID